MLVCERHSLYDAIIYIHNNAILDYISPAEKLLSELSSALASGQPLNDKQVIVAADSLVSNHNLFLLPTYFRIIEVKREISKSCKLEKYV